MGFGAQGTSPGQAGRLVWLHGDGAYGREALLVPAVVQAGNVKGNWYCPTVQQCGFSSALIADEISSVQD